MKLKMIKISLEDWHQQHSKNIEGKILEVKNRMSFLVSKGEEFDLLADETKEIRDLSVELHSLFRVHTSICWQKARMNWVKEGDANSKKIHHVMSNRHRRNYLHMIHVDSVLVEGVQNIRSAVLNHFTNQFRATEGTRPGIQDLNFRKLSYAQSGNLIRPFSLEEVKQAIWDCDSFKSLGPDDIHFGFIKDFWNELKHDFMKFMVDFHINGKL